MGSCCCSCMKYDRRYSYAYRTELGSALVKELLPKLPAANSKVIRIRLKSIQDLEPTRQLYKIHPYVEMRLKTADPIAGDQHQRSSYKPNTLNPKWVSFALIFSCLEPCLIKAMIKEPDEKFQFILSESAPVDILLSV